jgi:hypothetical protein
LLSYLRQRASPNASYSNVYEQFLASREDGKCLDARLETHCDYVRLEVFKAVTMKNGVLWDVTPCGSCKNRRFGGT